MTGEIKVKLMNPILMSVQLRAPGNVLRRRDNAVKGPFRPKYL